MGCQGGSPAWHSCDWYRVGSQSTRVRGCHSGYISQHRALQPEVSRKGNLWHFGWFQHVVCPVPALETSKHWLTNREAVSSLRQSLFLFRTDPEGGLAVSLAPGVALLAKAQLLFPSFLRRTECRVQARQHLGCSPDRSADPGAPSCPELWPTRSTYSRLPTGCVAVPAVPLPDYSHSPGSASQCSKPLHC